MKILDLIDQDIPIVQGTETVSEAIKLFAKVDVVSLPVVIDFKFIGMLDRQCQQQEINHVKQLIRNDSKVIYSDDKVEKILQIKQFIIPVIDRKQTFVGCIRIENVIKKLLSQQKLFSSIIENSNDGILVINSQGEIELINEALVNLSGISREQYLGKNIREIIITGIFKKSSVTLRALKEKRVISDFQQYSNNIDVLVKAIPMFDENNRLTRVLANVHDISELVHSKKELEKMQIISEKYQKKVEELLDESNHAGAVIVSSQMKEIMNLIDQIADTDSTILISGESGVGKEVISREIHRKSKREKAIFIKVNCGAIPQELLESEFFGYESGAFTGAKTGGKQGLFELANKGTLFLDEIGELPLNLQTKLLRFLQERVLTRVGGTREIPIDVRIIAATNRNLEEMVESGTFREDLFYRLNVIPIVLPPLRDRKEEIIPLVVHFLRKFNQKYERNKFISTTAMEILKNYSWKGNIRELSNIIERLVLTVKSDEIFLENLPAKILRGNGKIREVNKQNHILFEKVDYETGNLFEKMEKKLILTYLEEKGSIRKAAKALGVSHTTLMRKMKKHDIGLKI